MPSASGAMTIAAQKEPVCCTTVSPMYAPSM
jgi:hypothetical protein